MDNKGIGEWEETLQEFRLGKEDIHKLVIDFMVTEGFSKAADAFRREASVDYEIPGDVSAVREEIRSNIHRGNIQKATELLNELNPEILDNDPHLNFTLKRQQFIEFIRQGDLEIALQYAEQELAPRTELNESFMKELESAMSLFAFDQKSIKDSPVADLLNNTQRQNTASLVNAAILKGIHQQKSAKLTTILQTMMVSQNTLSQNGNYPVIDMKGTLTIDKDKNLGKK